MDIRTESCLVGKLRAASLKGPSRAFAVCLAAGLFLWFSPPLLPLWMYFVTSPSNTSVCAVRSAYLGAKCGALIMLPFHLQQETCLRNPEYSLRVNSGRATQTATTVSSRSMGHDATLQDLLHVAWRLLICCHLSSSHLSSLRCRFMLMQSQQSNTALPCTSRSWVDNVPWVFDCAFKEWGHL